MSKVRILIEMDGDANVAKAAAMDMSEGAEAAKAMKRSKTVSAVDEMDSLDIDTDFGVATLTQLAGGRSLSSFAAVDDDDFESRESLNEDDEGFASEAFDAQPNVEKNYLMRAEVDEKDADKVRDQLMKKPGVVGVFADVKLEPCLICPGAPPLGDDQTVERLLCASALRRVGADGEGVLVAIVDTGINMAHLNSKGKNPGFDAARSWVPRPGLTPGQLSVGHGTMCAFDACIAAPKCTLLDIALLQTQATGGTVMEGFLSDAVRAYNHLINVMRAPRRPGETRSLVVNNSWGMFHPSWDYPVGHPGNYSDNPNHPFNRIVTTLARHGADILFAAGNCGSDCPDSRCQGVTSKAIYGANSHSQVLSVAGVDTSKTRVGYSSKGPGRLVRNKPDIAGYTHFRGSGVYPADGGTSAACPVVAGVVAAIRTKRPYVAGNPSRSPSAIRRMFTSTAQDLGTSGYDFEHGYGVVNGCAIARQLRTIIIDICRIRPHLCRPIPLPPDLCRRFPRLCGPRIPIPPRIPPIPPRIPPIPPIPPRPGQDAYDADAEGMAMLDLGDGSVLEEMDMEDLADLFYYIGQYQALEGSGSGDAAPAKSGGQAGSGGGCGCGG